MNLNYFFPFANSALSPEIHERMRQDFVKADKVMLIIGVIAFISVALFTSIRYSTYQFGIINGGIALALMLVAYAGFKGTLIGRSVIGIALAIFPMIMIQQQLGMIEMHFVLFIVAAFLAVYKDITPILMATLAIAFHHIVLFFLQLNHVSLFGQEVIVFASGCDIWILITHIVLYTTQVIGLVYIIIMTTHQFITNNQLQIAADENVKALEQGIHADTDMVAEAVSISSDVSKGVIVRSIMAQPNNPQLRELREVFNSMLGALRHMIGEDIQEIIRVVESYGRLDFTQRIAKETGKIETMVNQLGMDITAMLQTSLTNGTRWCRRSNS